MKINKWLDRKRILATLNRDGFYMVLFLCLVILATTAVWVTRSNIKFFSQNDIFPDEMNMQEDYYIEELPVEEDENAASLDEGIEKDLHAEEEIRKQQTPVPQDTSAQQEEEKTEKPKEEPEAKETSASPQPSSTVSSSERMIRPVPGSIIMDFGKDTLVYSRTLEQWTTHYGIDIASDVGTPVKAALSGKVTDICTDPRLGIMITIDHGSGLVTRYANLQNSNMVKVGDKVERGKVISGVGRTAGFEVGDPPHLHFEVIKNGVHQDPKQYLPNI